MKVVVPFAAGLALATAAAPPQPAPHQMRATLDSPFMGQLLLQPMPSSAAEAVHLLHFSGNSPQAELLRRAYKRAALAQLVDEAPTTAPATIGEAIASESAALSLAEASRAAASRVIVTYPAGPLQLSVFRESKTHSRLTVTLRATNGLRAPVTRVVALAGSNALSVGLPGLALTCTPPAHRVIAPGATEVLFCEGGRATDQIDAGVQALKARQSPAVHTVDTPSVTLLDTEVLLRGEPESHQPAMARLAALPCEQKASCNAIAAEARRTWRTENGSTLLLAAAGLALAISAVVASRPRVVVKETALGAAAAGAVLLCSLFGLATMALVLAPGDARYLALLGLVIVSFGVLPFLAVLGALGAMILAGKVTPLRVLAFTFGVLSTALVVGVTWLE